MFLFEDSEDKVIRLEVEKQLEICSTNPTNPRKYNQAMEKIMVYIKKNDQKVIEQTVGFIKETIKNTDYQPVRKFQAIVLLKDLMKSTNKALGKYVVKKILKRLTIFAGHKAHTPQSKDENRGKDIFGRVNKDQQLYSIRFLNTLLSAIEEWSKNWPKAPDGPSQDFHEAYNDLLLSKIQFPQEVQKEEIKSAPPRPSKVPIPVSPSKSFIKDGDTQKHFVEVTESVQMMNQVLTEGQNYEETWPIIEAVVANTISLLQKGDEHHIRVGDMPDSHKPKAELKKKLDYTFDFLEVLTADSKVVGKKPAQYPTFRTKYMKLTKKLIADLREKQTPREAKQQSATPPKISRKWDSEEDNEPKIKGANRYDSTKGLRLEIDGKKQEQFASGSLKDQKLHGTSVGIEKKKVEMSQELQKNDENQRTAKVVSSSAFHIKDIKPKEVKDSQGSLPSEDSNEARIRKKKRATFSNQQPKVEEYVREDIKKAPIAPSKELQSSMRSNGSKSEINIFKDMEAKQKSEMPLNLVQIDNRRKNHHHKPAETAEDMFETQRKDASMTLGLDAFNQTKQQSIEVDRNASHLLGLNSATQMSKKNSINVSAFAILHKPSPFSIPKLASDSAFIPTESFSQIAAKNQKNNQTFDPFAQNSSVHSATNPFDNDSVASLTKRQSNNPFADNSSMRNMISMERLSPTKTEDISQRVSFKQIQNGEFKKKMSSDKFAEQFDNTVQHRQKLQQLIDNNPFGSSFKLETHEEEESAKGFQFDDFADPSKAEILNNKSNTQIPAPSAFDISDFNKVTRTRIEYEKSAMGISDLKNAQSNRTVEKRVPSFENVLSNGASQINRENAPKSVVAFSDFGEPTTSRAIPQQKTSNQSQFGVRFSEFPSANNSQLNPTHQGINFQSFLSQKQSELHKSGVDFNAFLEVGMSESKRFNASNDPYSSFVGQPPKKQSKNEVNFSQFGNPSSLEPHSFDFFQNVPIANQSNVFQKEQSAQEFNLSDFDRLSKKSKSQNDSMWNKFENISGKQLENSFNPNDMISNSNFFANPKAVENIHQQKKPTNVVTNEKELFANQSNSSEISSKSKQIKAVLDNRFPEIAKDLRSISSKGNANPEKNQAIVNFFKAQETNFKKNKETDPKEALFDAKSLSSIGQTKLELAIVGLKQQDIFEEFQNKVAKKSGTFLWEPIVSTSNFHKTLHINQKQLPSIRKILEERKREYGIQMKDLANLKNKHGEVRQNYLQAVDKVESAKTQANQYAQILRKIKFGNEVKELQISQIQHKITALTAKKREILQKQRLLQEIIQCQSINLERKSQMSRTKVEKWEMFNKNMQQYRTSAANLTNTASNFH